MHPGLGGRCTYSKRTLSVRLSERGVRLFPITSIELPHRHVQPVIRIQATQIDADALGVGTGPVKALYPACRAEDVPGLAAAEAIARRLRLAIRQPEGAFGHDQVQIAGHRADRAVAVQHFDIGRGKIGLEMEEAAMEIRKTDE